MISFVVFLINIIFLKFFHSNLGFNEYISQLLAIIITSILNFIGNYFITSDDIIDVEVKEADGEGEWKDFDIYEWEAAVEAHEEVPERFVEADSIDVDLYTNAIQSSIRYKEAVRNALRHARKNPEKDVE